MDKILVVLNVLNLVGVGIVGWLLRSYVPEYLRKKAENLATKEDVEEITHKVESVRTQYVIEAEKLRSELRVTAHERETRFARLHERRAEAIDGLYRRLVHTNDAFQALTGGVVSSAGDTVEARLEKARKCAHNLVAYFKRNRLYFDRDLISAFGEFEAALSDAWSVFILHRLDDWNELTRPEREQRVNEKRATVEMIRTKIPEMLDAIELTMRGLIGYSREEIKVRV